MKLWPHQESAIEDLRLGIRMGHKNQVLCAPTGSGKTVIATHLIQECVAKGKRAIFVADRVSLVDQTSAVLDSEGIEHGVLMGAHWRWRPWARVQVASAQTLHRRGWPESDLYIVDECHSIHRTVADEIRPRGVVTIGLSATPFTRGLGKLYDRVVCVTTTNKLIDGGYLAPFRIFAPKEPDMKGAKIVAGEWSDDVAAERSMPIVGDVVAEYLKHGGGKKAIVFGCNVAHCVEMQRQFQAAGIQAGLYTYRTGDDERAAMLTEYRKPDSYLRVLISVAALARGFDVPDVHCVILARPLRKSLAEHIQMLGRGLRKDPDDPAKVCTVLDLAGNTVRFWQPMNDFFADGLDTLDDGTKREAKPQDKPDKAKEPRRCPRCKHVHAPRPTCPSCGHEYPTRAIRHQAGELAEMGAGTATPHATRQDFFAELLFVERARAYKPGWALANYRDRFGAWPSGPQPEPKIPSASTLGWVQHRLIRRAKAMGKIGRSKASRK